MLPPNFAGDQVSTSGMLPDPCGQCVMDDQAAAHTNHTPIISTNNVTANIAAPQNDTMLHSMMSQDHTSATACAIFLVFIMRALSP